MSDAILALSEWLGPAVPVVVLLLKLTLLLLLALAATWAMPRASAGTRHLVWLVALGALLLLPALATWGPLRVGVLPAKAAVATDGPVGGPEQGAGAAVTATSNGPAVSGLVLPSQSAESWLPSVPATAAIWGLVALILLARLGHGAWSVGRIVRRARPLDAPEWQVPLYEIADRLGLEQAPVLVRSDEVKMPFAAGLFRVTIVLPAESDAWSSGRRSAVLIHELGHAARRDLLGHTLGRIACALYWFHPLVWTAARQLRAESERACDDLAILFGARPADYAEHLLDIVTCVRDHRTPAVALALAHRREFEGRMLAILNPDLARRGPSGMQRFLVSASLASLAFLMGVVMPVPREAAAQDRVEPPAVVSRLNDAPDATPIAPVTPARPRPEATPAPRPLPEATPSPAPSSGLSAAEPGDDRAVTLARTLRTDTSAEVRRVAAWGLSRYARMDVAQEALVGALGTDADPKVREMAAWALSGARRSTAAGTVLARAIGQDKDASVRATAVWSAGSVGDPAALPALLGALGDADARVRELAAWSVGSIRPEQAPAPLVRALEDKDRVVRRSAAWALYTIADPASTDALDAAYRKETDADVRMGLIRALGAMGDRSVPALEKLVTSPDSAVRAIAITALAGGNATGPWPMPRPQPRPFP